MPHTRHYSHYAVPCEKVRPKPPPPPEPPPPPPPPPPPEGCGEIDCEPKFTNGPPVVIVDVIGAPAPFTGPFICAFAACIAAGGRWDGTNAFGMNVQAAWHIVPANSWSISSDWGAGCDIWDVDVCTGGLCWDIMMPWPFLLTIPPA